jgi:hypothetical protein
MATQNSEGKPQDPKAERSEPIAPRPYTPPALRRLGSVRDLTLGGSTGPAEQGKMSPKM